MRRKFLIPIVIIILLVVFVLFLQFSTLSMNHDVYPDTDEAPVLDFIWGIPELEMDQIERVTPYGVWEGAEGIWEPAVEIQFYTKDRWHDPVYAACEGTLIDISTERQSLVIRYGRNYGIVYHHIVDFPSSLKVGEKIERGDLIGYTEKKSGLGWWEIEVDVKRGDVFRTVPPIDYFSEESQEKLNDILNGDDVWYENKWGANRTWTVTEGEESWIKYLDEPEWWTSPFRVGYSHLIGAESLEDFVTAHNMTWVLENYGPSS